MAQGKRVWACLHQSACRKVFFGESPLAERHAEPSLREVKGEHRHAGPVPFGGIDPPRGLKL
jgi:hypothetical protein